MELQAFDAIKISYADGQADYYLNKFTSTGKIGPYIIHSQIMKRVKELPNNPDLQVITIPVDWDGKPDE